MIVSATYRDLTSLDDFAVVVELERRIWGVEYSDVVPVPILAVTVHRGGILIGAFAGDEMIGFVYSLPGIKHGKATQWSHMLGILPEYRNAGIGWQLKVLQRERARAMGLDLIEWTFDPLQAANAHLNFAKLGVVAEEYLENVYGNSTSPLHRGNPTDRFVAEWHIGNSADRAEGRGQRAEKRAERSEMSGEPAVVNRVERRGEWLCNIDADLSRNDSTLTVVIPVGFTEMLSVAPDLAMEWRLATRAIFTAYFARGYRAVAFELDRQSGRGTYFLSREASAAGARR